MKHSRLVFAFITILGIIFLILIPIGSYLYYRDSVSFLASLNLSAQLGFWFFLSGISLVTIGIIGLDLKNVRKWRKRFTALYILIIPITSFVMVLLASVFPSVGFISIQRSEITKMTVIDTNPLILSVDVKAITSRDSRIENAVIFNDDNGTLVIRIDPDKNLLAVLPTGSEITLTLNFDIALTSGNYTLSLSSWHVGHDSFPFTIP